MPQREPLLCVRTLNSWISPELKNAEVKWKRFCPTWVLQPKMVVSCYVCASFLSLERILAIIMHGKCSSIGSIDLPLKTFRMYIAPVCSLSNYSVLSLVLCDRCLVSFFAFRWFLFLHKQCFGSYTVFFFSCAQRRSI